MHHASAHLPDSSRSPVPNKNRVTDFEQANNDACNGEQIFQSDEYLRCNQVEWWPDERAPKIRTIPPAASQAFCYASKKINETEMNLQHTAKEPEQMWIFRWQLSPSLIE